MAEAKTSTTVSDVTGLVAAVKGAAPGDVIALEPGDYAMPTLANVSFDAPVTITSADQASPARLVGLKVGNAAGLTFEHLILTVVDATDPYFEFRITRSRALTFRNLLVTGDPASGPEYALSAVAFLFQNCEDVRIEHNLFRYLWAALVVSGTQGLTVQANRFEYVNKGCVEVTSSGPVLVAYNYFTNFSIAGGVHGDAIQIYTANTTVPSHDIQIIGNLYLRGAGMAAQGIFMRDETTTLPYRNVKIVQNYMIGGMWNGVALDHCEGSVHVDKNRVETWPGFDNVAGRQTEFKSWIRLNGDMSGCSSLTLSYNKAQAYVGQSGPPLVPPPGVGNAITGPVADNGLAGLKAWAAAFPAYRGVLDTDAQARLGINVPRLVGIGAVSHAGVSSEAV